MHYTEYSLSYPLYVTQQKATERHIKQVAGDHHVAQLNLMCHQHTELPNGKYKKKNPQTKQKQAHHKTGEQRPPNQYKKSFDPKLAHKKKDNAASAEILVILKGSSVQLKSISAKHATSLATTQDFASRKSSKNYPITITENPLHIS